MAHRVDRGWGYAVNTFLLPDLGEGLTEAEIVRWLVTVGETVAVDQPVVEVETAKATVEVPSPYAGEVVELHGAEGAVVDVGAALISIGTTAGVESARVVDAGAGSARGAGVGAGAAGAGAGVIGAGAGAGAGSAGAGAASAGSGAVLVGYGTVETPRRNRRPRRSAPAPAAASTATTAEFRTFEGSGVPPTLKSPKVGGAVQPAVVSPVVRRLAREYGLDLATLHGSGRGGLIIRADVERAAAAAQPSVPEPLGAAEAATTPGTLATPGAASGGLASNAAPGAGLASNAAPAAGLASNAAPAAGLAANAVPAAGLAPNAGVAPAAGRGVGGMVGDERVPLRGLRRVVAEKLGRSRREIPDATTWVDVDATGLLDAKAATGVGILALMARFCVAGLRRFPELNSSVDVEASELVRHARVHLGFAAQTDRGLVVPVIRDADQRSTADLAAEIARLTAAARAGTLAPADLTGGTFTLNNYGVFGVDGSDAIINHPEAAILGIGRLMPRPWVVEGAVAVRTVTQLSLSFDHRVCDGGVAGGFLRYVADLVESPHRLLPDV